MGESIRSNTVIDEISKIVGVRNTNFKHNSKKSSGLAKMVMFQII